MKTVLKSLVIGLTVFVLSFAPPLASMAQAGSIHYEGISSVNSDTQSKGLMLNFSFGGPKDYKPESSLQDIYKASLTKNQWVGLGAATLGVIVLSNSTWYFLITPPVLALILQLLIASLKLKEE